MMHPAFVDGYAQEPTFSMGFTVPARYFVSGMFHFAAGLRAKAVATAVGVSLDPEVWCLETSHRSPNAVPGCLDWFKMLAQIDKRHEAVVTVARAFEELGHDPAEFGVHDER